MVERKTLRNVLHEVLSAADQDDVPGLEGLSALIHRQIPPQQPGKARHEKRSPQEQQGAAPVTDGCPSLPGDQEEAGRRKAIHYLSEETLDDLGWARARLRKLLTDKMGQSPSNSEIVDKALQIVLDEFQEKGMDSTLVQKIMSIGEKPA